MKFLRSPSIVLCGAVLASNAWALNVFSVVNGYSENGLGTFSGTVTYDPTAAAELTISLTNTSPGANGGYLTAIAFNMGGTVSALTAPFPGEATDAFLVGPVAVPPPGQDFRDWGSSIGDSWTGGGPSGGSPNDGVGVGSTGVWSFDVVNGPASLNYSQLAMEVRFRGFVDGGSDKVTAVPEPEAYAMALAALGVMAVFRRRRQK